jgi:hypothetical protein
VRTDDGSFSYEIPTDAAGLVSTAFWLRARMRPFLYVGEAVAVGYVVLGVLSRSLFVLLTGLALGIFLPVVLRVSRRRHRSILAKRMGPQWRAMFGPGGVRVDHALTSTSFAWAHFGGWTVHKGELLLVHAGPPLSFVAVPIALVPEDEWQQLTTLLFEKLGPARTAESVRGGRLNRSTSRKLGEAATIHP